MYTTVGSCSCIFDNKTAASTTTATSRKKYIAASGQQQQLAINEAILRYPFVATTGIKFRRFSLCSKSWLMMMCLNARRNVCCLRSCSDRGHSRKRQPLYFIRKNSKTSYVNCRRFPPIEILPTLDRGGSTFCCHLANQSLYKQPPIPDLNSPLCFQ